MLQVVTANIGGHRNYRDESIVVEDIARQMKNNLPLDYTVPTVIALQEVIQIAYEDDVSDIGTSFARILGEDYRAYFAQKISSETHPHATGWGKPSYAGMHFVAEGNGIVTNIPLADWPWRSPDVGFPGYENKTPIVTHLGLPCLYSTGNRNTEPRNLIVAPLATEWGVVYFMVTHLSTLKGEDRFDPHHPISIEAGARRLIEIQHVIQVLDELRTAEKLYAKPHRPVILAGDFNVDIDREEMLHLQTRFSNLNQTGEKPTYTYRKHEIEIDHILVNDPRQFMGSVQNVYVIDDLAVPDLLDHFPKVASFTR